MAHVSTFEFPIKDLGGVTQMHIIPPYSIPNFHHLTNKDTDTFLFEFEILCRGYDYYTNNQKVESVPSYSKRSNSPMVHEPRWELHPIMGGHEEHILEEVRRLLQIK